MSQGIGKEVFRASGQIDEVVLQVMYWASEDPVGASDLVCRKYVCLVKARYIF